MPIEDAKRSQTVEVEVWMQKISERLRGDDYRGDRILEFGTVIAFSHAGGRFEELADSFISDTAEFSHQGTPEHEGHKQNFWEG